jgi:hypothetical protein
MVRLRRGRVGVALQELQGLQIEFLDLLIDGRVRTPFKDQQLRIPDITVHLRGKTCGGHLIEASECNLRRRRDSTKLRRDVMGDYGIRLLDKGCAGRLRTKSANDRMYSALAAYSSGVKHQGKIARITIWSRVE